MTFALGTIMATLILTGTIPTTTVTGPILLTPTPPIAQGWWEDAEYTLEPVLPDFIENMALLLDIAKTWIQQTWLESSILDYWMLYQAAVFLFGRFLGNILGRGGFSVRDRIEAQGGPSQHQTEEK
jgi:hypothetical protein